MTAPSHIPLFEYPNIILVTSINFEVYRYVFFDIHDTLSFLGLDILLSTLSSYSLNLPSSLVVKIHGFHSYKTIKRQ